MASKGKAMARNLHPSAVVPASLLVQHVEMGRRSNREHEDGCARSSRNVRTLADLPLCGRPVRLRLVVRRLRCEMPACPQRIFTERLELGEPWGWPTVRLAAVAHQLGSALDSTPKTAQSHNPPDPDRLRKAVNT